MTQFPMPPAVAPLAEKSAAHPGDIALRKEYGAALHRHGLPERALPVFESILAADANDPHAAAACVNLLAGLSRPQAAQRMALDHRELLEQTAPGRGAMATAALGVKDTALARRHLEAALGMAPRDPQLLARLAELEARAGEHAAAIGHLETALQLDAGQPARWANLADALTMARRDTDALSIVRRALQEFPGDAALGARLPVLYAYAGDFTAAGKALALLPETSYPLLARVLAAASPASAAALRASTGILPNPQELFTHHAFDAMRDADWRLEKQVTQVLRELIAQAARQGGEPDWRDAQFYTLLLPMSEDEQLRMRDITAATVRTRTARRPIADTGTPPPRKDDGRFHIGISTPSLLEENTVQALMAQLRLHDRGRFAFHLYSPIPSVDDAAAKYFEGVAEVVDIGHLTPREAVLRMRLDQLDLWMDLTYFTPTCRVEIPAYRVAPVQLRRQTWQRTHRTQPCEYTIGDTFTHPGSTAAESGFGHIARFPFTSWLDAGRPAAAPQPSRAEVGLPADSLVLSAFSPAAVTIDPESFGAWMRILAALPGSVLWLIPVNAAARANLEREATAAGIDAARLVFAPKSSREALHALMPLADLHLDTLRFSGPQMSADFLRAGVPVLALAGNNMASRLGGSVVRAAGLAECVLPDTAAYVAEAIRLGRETATLAALREKLLANQATAPLFDMPSRVREWENAWVSMIERQRAGLPPQAFDVTPANP